MTKRYVRVRTPEDFPQPTRFGIHRPRGKTFTLHDTLSLVKSAISNETRSWNETFHTDYDIYEWVEGEWCHIFNMRMGDVKAQHVLWQGAAPKTAGLSEAATEKAVAAAIQSLTNTGSNT